MFLSLLGIGLSSGPAIVVEDTHQQVHSTTRGHVWIPVAQDSEDEYMYTYTYEDEEEEEEGELQDKPATPDTLVQVNSHALQLILK